LAGRTPRTSEVNVGRNDPSLAGLLVSTVTFLFISIHSIPASSSMQMIYSCHAISLTASSVCGIRLLSDTCELSHTSVTRKLP
jgi:hypothetical protein